MSSSKEKSSISFIKKGWSFTLVIVNLTWLLLTAIALSIAVKTIFSKPLKSLEGVIETKLFVISIFEFRA